MIKSFDYINPNIHRKSILNKSEDELQVLSPADIYLKANKSFLLPSGFKLVSDEAGADLIFTPGSYLPTTVNVELCRDGKVKDINIFDEISDIKLEMTSSEDCIIPTDSLLGIIKVM